MRPDYDVAIIGAGAAGLTAAIFAKQTAPDARVVAFDGAPKIGSKILISGGGRCNVTHDVVTPDDFNGNRNAIAKVLRTFTVEQTIEWFASMGVALKREETGKLFPVTDRARTVVDALLRAAEGVEILTSRRVQSLDEVPARCVILATGGRSVPKTGSDGHGYTMVRAVGHTVTEVFPALVPLVLPDGHWMTRISGASTDAELSVRSATGRVVTKHRGSLLFTHFGLSGPVVLDISRHWIAERGALVANFLPGETFESLEAMFIDANARATVASVLRGRIPERLLAQLTTAQALGQMKKEERRRIVRALVEHVVPVVRDRGFDYAEVTAGGVPLSEVDLSTMASRKRNGLYLCGEILDVDGRIGGYNFQWAWASGRLAGIHAAREGVAKHL
ncbi:MAG TPA: aminoacetone oxidase family FAD-binding enzyme [Thermoanaerobaculia bacterium]|nr:aminoacetone oxidase family FAD-binding enzyme [Thermoanaerobaculia bacterium]